MTGACCSTATRSWSWLERWSESAASEPALRGKNSDDVLFLQIKQAQASVLEPHLTASRYRNQGQRVVTGQRLLQAMPDQLLGWSTGPGGTHRAADSPIGCPV